MHGSRGCVLGVCLLALFPWASFVRSGPIEERLSRAFARLDPSELTTGVLYDRVLPLSGIERMDGSGAGPAISLRTWNQLYDELRRASANPGARPGSEVLRDRARADRGTIPVVLLWDRYERIRPDAMERGLLRMENGQLVRSGAGRAYELHESFAASALREGTYQGSAVSFELDPGLIFSNMGHSPGHMELDPGDGLGFRVFLPGSPLSARYRDPGRKSVTLRISTADGRVLQSTFDFQVHALVTPAPNDTLHATGTISYLSGVASGQGYVYLAPGHAVLTNPVVVVEGFDLDNSMNWNELYALLNQQNLLENLRADGYDAVVLNFTDATDYLQRNSFMLVDLLQQIRARVGPNTSIAVAGASMGGLVARFALAFMEVAALPHNVRTYLSFDTPHLGADIPLGIQYWTKFFSGQSTDAAYLLSRLDTPASRQMLVHHYTNPPGTTGAPDALRATFLSDLAAAGNLPTQLRRVAIANGSGLGVGQGFLPGAQIVQWNYSSLFVNITGNVWAVADGGSQKIFDGRLRIIFPDTRQAVTVSGTRPYDNAPGGSRASMAQMDATAAPFGDIVALYPSHCFIPTVSALALDSPDLFHSIGTDPAPLTHTPFDAIYFPASNQEHVAITAENAAWIRTEIERGVTAVESQPGRERGFLEAPAPNPASIRAQLRLFLPQAGAVSLRILSVDGREVARLAEGSRPAGTHELSWTGRDGRGAAVPSGVYLVRLEVPGNSQTRRLVWLR